MTDFWPCEHCKERNSLLYVLFPNRKGFPYLMVCKVCVADIGQHCIADLKAMCDDDDGEYKWSGEVVDGSRNVLWTETDGQLFNPDADTRTFSDVPAS